MSSSSPSPSAPFDKGLFPGYRHVESFGSDEDYEDEVEECYITLDLSSVDQTLVPSSSSYRLIGLDTPTPFLQLSGTIMKGHYQTLIGTELIFKDVAEESGASSLRNSNVQYFTKTDRRILFREVELKPKTSNDATSASSVSLPREKKYTFISPLSADDLPGVSNVAGPVTAVPGNPEVTGQPEQGSMQVDAEVSAASEGRDEEGPISEVRRVESMEVDT